MTDPTEETPTQPGLRQAAKARQLGIREITALIAELEQKQAPTFADRLKLADARAALERLEQADR